MKKRGLGFFCLFFCMSLFSQNSPDIKKGLGFLKNNNPEKALPIFFAETEKVDGDRKAYLYLSVACIQLQKYSDAVAWLSKGKSLDPTDNYLYSYNLGNAYFMQGAYEKALLAYIQAASENPYYSATFLNKANTEMQLGKQEDALKSYKTYLQLEPMSSQRPSIERMISILQGQEDTRQAEVLRQQAEEKTRLERERLRQEEEEQARRERERLRQEEEEQARRERERLRQEEEEQARREREKLRQEEEEQARRERERLRQEEEEQARRERERLRQEQEKALLDKVNKDLANSDSATSVSAGSEDTIDYKVEEGKLE